jgi:glutamate synthase domain-containing protein 2
MTGGKLLVAMGADEDHPVYFDRLVLDACQVTNPSIDPLREPMELRTFLGRKPAKLEFVQENGRTRLLTEKHPVRVLDAPLMFAGMSYGAISLNAQKALARAAFECNIMFNTGEGGLHEDLRPYRDVAMGQCASGRFGLDMDYLNTVAAIEIKIGQGAKPGIGGHLPGEKVDESISWTRKIPVGSDALSPAPHHDIYSIEDLKQLIFALKEATGYAKPVGVKIAAVHNVAAIASGIVLAGADFITIDGYRGSTGAAPQVVRDHVGIPLELALAAVDDRLSAEGTRNQVTIIATGGIRSSADVAKAIALGADIVAIGTAALVALGCTRIKQCHTNKCPWGIATQDPDLVKRLDPDWGAKRVINLIRAWELELKEFLGALGINAIESLRGNRERLRGIHLTEEELAILGVKHAGH